MSMIQTIVLMITSTVFGVLITYFFKTISQTKSLHAIVDNKIETYSKEVDYKLSQIEKQTKILFTQGSLSKDMLHGIDVSIAGIFGELKLLKERSKNASN